MCDWHTWMHHGRGEERNTGHALMGGATRCASGTIWAEYWQGEERNALAPRMMSLLLTRPPRMQGDWVDNKMHGHGVFTDASGHKWEGDFHNGSGPGLTCDLR